MNLYIYLMPGGALSARGKEEGLNGLISEDHYRFQEHRPSCLKNAFRFVGNFVDHYGTAEDVLYTRTYTTTVVPHMQLLRRLLTARSTWSKKTK